MSGLRKNIDRQTSKTQNNEVPKSVGMYNTKDLDLSRGKCACGSVIPLLSFSCCHRVEFYTRFDWCTEDYR